MGLVLDKGVLNALVAAVQEELPRFKPDRVNNVWLEEGSAAVPDATRWTVFLGGWGKPGCHVQVKGCIEPERLMYDSASQQVLSLPSCLVFKVVLVVEGSLQEHPFERILLPNPNLVHDVAARIVSLMKQVRRPQA